MTLVASAAPVPNGDFETGDLTGWTTFTTASGTIGTPAVVSFDTTGTGASNAAKFNVGQRRRLAGIPQGGGIYQSVNTAAGEFDVSADVAAHLGHPPSRNQSCGLFELACRWWLSSRATTSLTRLLAVPDSHDCPQPR